MSKLTAPHMAVLQKTGISAAHAIPASIERGTVHISCAGARKPKGSLVCAPSARTTSGSRARCDSQTEPQRLERKRRHSVRDRAPARAGPESRNLPFRQLAQLGAGRPSTCFDSDAMNSRRIFMRSAGTVSCARSASIPAHRAERSWPVASRIRARMRRYRRVTNCA